MEFVDGFHYTKDDAGGFIVGVVVVGSGCGGPPCAQEREVTLILDGAVFVDRFRFPFVEQGAYGSADSGFGFPVGSVGDFLPGVAVDPELQSGEGAGSLVGSVMVRHVGRSPPALLEGHLVVRRLLYGD
ncbi:hypothetical protein [Nocardia cyriacigeorgica]|uniref:Uncharacterized protein n=1 Tax=Nocardia cyriacigeorgica TaxID=135487 RepID=A0A5R8NEK2_9NOCA|nr:hypothetical protein [Nocardia cyriacigeorgica]TLF74036.1 hypothetical protein FEK34_25275 [Nocardia cyriacigeorgica]